MLTCLHYRNDAIYHNPVFTSGTETIKDKVSGYEKENVYDEIKYDDIAVGETVPTSYQNFPTACVKSTASCDKCKESAAQYENSTSPNKLMGMPVAKAKHCFPTNDNMSQEEEYVFPADISYRGKNPYNTQGEAHKTNNHYTSLQCSVNQLPSTYVSLRKTPAAK